MAVFVPFKGLRYRVDNRRLQNLVCPPYDIISGSERAALIAKDPDNIVSVELPEGGEDRYALASEHLSGMVADGLLAADAEAFFYVCRMEFISDGEKKSVEGVIGRLRLEPLDGGVVLPHENTLSKAKDDRLALMKATAANISSVYSLFSDADGTVRSVIADTIKGDAVSVVTMDGVTHSLYPVSGDGARLISDAFYEKSLFIADGHHRYETGLNYKAYRESLGETVDDSHPANYIMMTCVPLEHPGLVVYPTHRIIRKSVETASLPARFEKEFDVIDSDSADDAKAMLAACYENETPAFLFYDGRYRLLRLKRGADLSQYMPGRSDSYRRLDVSILHAVILERIFGIGPEDMASGRSLVYTRDFNEAIAAVDDKEACCSFILNPTRVSEIAAVALDGERMPQKSTYFYPKLITGMVLNRM